MNSKQHLFEHLHETFKKNAKFQTLLPNFPNQVLEGALFTSGQITVITYAVDALLRRCDNPTDLDVLPISHLVNQFAIGNKFGLHEKTF